MGEINIEQILKSEILKHIITIIIVMILGKIVLKLLNRLIEKIFSGKMDADGYRKVRIETLSKNFCTVIKFLVGFIIAIIILDMLGINTRSLIATAGIGGIAIAFGTQTLIKDLITGIIIIVDDTYRVGDWVKAGGVEGTVETLGMRHTKIRDYKGSLYTIPNSQITVVENMNSGPMKFECDIQLSYEVPIDKAKELIKEVSKKLKAEKDLNKYIIEDVDLFGVVEIKENSYCIRTTATAVPGYQSALARREKKLIVEEIIKNNLKTCVNKIEIIEKE
ncbi:mechanosensitive ion channel family protein [Anaerococcus sp. Marseille-P3625]|uniref:mechanosensitive ion channel family protein n=1 Tax=Anaerococcus sp. Marseille-P3625 TaxID=1977277 RepID=UPI0015DF8B5D|nr:mechanosensitive ion channel family protein [Anaerococcus sp. Marseille-P3625]